MTTRKWVFLIPLLTTLLGSQAWSRDFESIKKSGTIKFATEGAFDPFNFFKGKELTGFEVDLAAAIAGHLGVKIEWTTLGFDSLLIGLNQDRYDVVIASHGITPEREKAVDFSNPHYCTGGVIVALAGGAKTKSDLNGKRVGVQIGTTYATDAKKIPGVKEVKTYPKDTDALQSLLGKKVDAWVTDRFMAIETQKKGKTAPLQIGEMVFTERVAMAIAKGNSSLKTKLNTALMELQKGTEYQKISQAYFGQDIRCK